LELAGAWLSRNDNLFFSPILSKDMAKLVVRNTFRRNLFFYLWIAFCSMAVWSIISFVRSKLFILGSYDTAFHLQALWRLSRFQMPTSTFNEFYSALVPMNWFMGQHFQYSALMFAPFFQLGLSPMVVSQYIIPSLTLLLTVIYWQKLFPDPKALFPGAIGLILLFWSPYSGMGVTDFHLDNFVAPWVCATLFYLECRKFRWMLFFLIIVTGFKEYFAIFAAVVCFLYFYENKDRSALIAGFGFLVYTAIIMIYVMPHFFEGNSLALYLFGEKGASWGARIRFVIEKTFRWQVAWYLFDLLFLFLFLPLLVPRIFALSLPILAINILSGFDNAIDKYYYTAVPNAVLAVAFVGGFQKIALAFQAKLNNKGAFVAIVAVLSLLSLPWGCFRNTIYRIKVDLRSYLSRPSYMSELEKILRGVNDGDVLSVSAKVSPYVIRNRAWVFPKPFGDPNLGCDVNKIIIAKHHDSYLDNFSGNYGDLREFLSELIKKYQFKVQMESQYIIFLERVPP